MVYFSPGNTPRVRKKTGGLVFSFVNMLRISSFSEYRLVLAVRRVLIHGSIQQDDSFGSAHEKQAYNLWICEACFSEEYCTGSTTSALAHEMEVCCNQNAHQCGR